MFNSICSGTSVGKQLISIWFNDCDKTPPSLTPTDSPMSMLIGESVGVKEGGVLSQSLNQIEISCFPTDVPEQIELNIEDLELNSAKSVGDLELGLEDVDIITDPSVNIVSITPPAAEEVVEVDSDEELGEGGDDSDVEPGSEEEKESSSGDSEQKTEDS